MIKFRIFVIAALLIFPGLLLARTFTAQPSHWQRNRFRREERMGMEEGKAGEKLNQRENERAELE